MCKRKEKNLKLTIFIYGNYISTLTDFLNDIYGAFLLSLVKHSFMVIVN